MQRFLYLIYLYLIVSPATLFLRDDTNHNTLFINIYFKKKDNQKKKKNGFS